MNLYSNSGPETEYRHEYIDPKNVHQVRRNIIKELFPNSNGTLDLIQYSDLNTLHLPILATKTLAPAKLANLAIKRKNFVDGARKAYYPKEVWDIKLDESLDELRIVKAPKNNKNPKQIEDKKPNKSKITVLPKKVNVPSNQRTLFGYITSKAWSTNVAAQQGTPGIATSSIPSALLLSESKTMGQSSNDSPKSTNREFSLVECIEELDARDGTMFMDDVLSVASGNDDDTDDVVEHHYTWDSIRMTFPKDKRYIS